MVGPLLLILVLTAFTVAMALVLVGAGERNGDRVDDATVRVRLGRPGTSRDAAPFVSIDVDNATSGPVMVTADVRRAWRAALSVRASRTVSVLGRPQGRRPTPGTVLGAVETGTGRSWDLPVISSAGAVKVRVRLHHADGRTPVITHLIGGWGPVPGSPRPASIWDRLAPGH